MQKDDGIFINQDKYVADILKKFDFSSIKATSTPIETNKALLNDEETVDVHLYRSMIGSLMNLTAYRPDIMFVVCAYARFQVTLNITPRVFGSLTSSINLQTTKKIVLIKQKMQAAQDRQKNYADRKQKPMEFEIGDWVCSRSHLGKGLYDSCRSPVCWTEVGEARILGPELIQETTEKIVQIKKRMQAAGDRQKNYADLKRVIGKVTYKLNLPEELTKVHNTFHVPNLKKCHADEPLAIPLDGLHFGDKLHFVEEPVEIMDREVK
nr:putative reverse transcriptase domain-containing protein [Tanacetum cinerariifolium]